MSNAISFPAFPLSQSMAGDPPVAALVRMRRGGLRPNDDPSWTKLLRCVQELPESLPVKELPLRPRAALPQLLA